MKTLDLNAYGVEEMSKEEMINESGGWIQFLAGAILGGVIYDLYKMAVTAAVEVTAEGPENANSSYTSGYPSRVWH